MKVAIRADASIKIGTGHIMRCLTLADTFGENDDVWFLCRPHDGHLIDLIKLKGYRVKVLEEPVKDSDNDLSHSVWLGSTQKKDAEQCLRFLQDSPVDWLIVDHYALDKKWQGRLSGCYKRLMVIDDLADREHLCDVLLDQNYASTKTKYQGLVPNHCQVLAGTEYTLLRPEFSQWREKSLRHRNGHRQLKSLLINLGGIDVDNLTAKLINQLQECDLPSNLSVIVIMGKAAPHISEVKQCAKRSKFNIEVKVDVSNVAQIMASADLAIGAAGSSAWERCCLGLPTILMITAENQKIIANALLKLGAVKILEQLDKLSEALSYAESHLSSLSNNCSEIVDGRGALKVNHLVSNVFFNSAGCALVPYYALTKNQSLFVLQMRNHIEIRKWMNQQNVIPELEHLSFVESLINRDDRRFFVVEQGENVIGAINFTSIDVENFSAEFGIFANPFLKKKGRGKILMTLVLDYAENVLQLRKLDLEVLSNNRTAICLYSLFGFYEKEKNKDFQPSMIYMTKDLTVSYAT